MSHSAIIGAPLKARKTDIKKIMASADLSLSQKALRGRSDISQSIMCLRVANKLRKITYEFDIPVEIVNEQTGISMPTLLDIDCRSVLISTTKLAIAEIALDAYLELLEKDHLSHLEYSTKKQEKALVDSDRWRKGR